MFKTENTIMDHRPVHSSQDNNFYGVVWLLVVACLWSILLSSPFGFVMMGGLIGILCTRAQWARIVTLVVAAYVGLVGLLVSVFARGIPSFGAIVAALMAGTIFFLLVRPGMDRYFCGKARSQVIPPAPRPGALSHVQHHPAAPPVSRTDSCPATPNVARNNTHEQWARLQQQLRAEQAKEEREQQSLETPSSDQARNFPWLTLVLSVLAFAYATSAAGEVGKLAMLIVIPGFVAAMVRWIHPRGFALAVLALSCGLILQPEWKLVAPGIRVVLQHHGPMVFAAIALLIYSIALAATGLAENGENHA
jgi:hypothetical protein